MSIHLKGEVGVCMTNFRITKKMRDAANSGEYSLTEDEICEINEHNKLVKKKRKKIKEQRNTVYECTYTLLSEKLGIEITKNTLQQCKSYKGYKGLGNARFQIKCIDLDNMIIHIKPQKGQALTVQLH